MILRLPTLFARKPSPIEQAEAAAIAKVNTRALSKARAAKQDVLHAQLRGYVESRRQAEAGH